MLICYVGIVLLGSERRSLENDKVVRRGISEISRTGARASSRSLLVSQCLEPLKSQVLRSRAIGGREAEVTGHG